MTADELLARVKTSPVRSELAQRVLEAASRTATLEEKIDALGGVLAHGMGDDACLDEALLLVAALAECEKPHVRLLAAI